MIYNQDETNLDNLEPEIEEEIVDDLDWDLLFDKGLLLDMAWEEINQEHQENTRIAAELVL